MVAGERDKVTEMRRQHDEAGPRTGFDDFVRAQYRELVGFLSRRNSPEDAEEIAQESIISLMNYREKGQVSDWRPLLYRIAINHAQKRVRREAQHRNGRCEVEAEQIADEMPLPEEQLEQAQRAERLQAAILGLPPKCRRVYLLRHGHGLSHAKIAGCCGISVKMVEKHLATAVLQLQRKVGFPREQGL